MIYLKSEEEIEIMKKAGTIAAAAMKEVEKNISPGIKTIELDKIAKKVIEGLGASSSFKKVDGYKYTTCTTPNDWVVHGLPGGYTLKEGDLVGVDLGAFYAGFHSDMAQTYAVGRVDSEKRKFLDCGQTALNKALKQVKAGNHIGDISFEIQNTVEGSGYSVVKELVGHGVGKNLHEDPLVPGVGKKGKGEKLKEGMVLAVEVIYCQGKPQVELLEDGWTISTKDGSMAGLFERTIALRRNGPEVLTRMPV